MGLNGLSTTQELQTAYGLLRTRTTPPPPKSGWEVDLVVDNWVIKDLITCRRYFLSYLSPMLSVKITPVKITLYCYFSCSLYRKWQQLTTYISQKLLRGWLIAQIVTSLSLPQHFDFHANHFLKAIVYARPNRKPLAFSQLFGTYQFCPVQNILDLCIKKCSQSLHNFVLDLYLKM